MTLDDLYGHLLAHELRLEQNQPAVDLALASANIVAKKGSSRGGSCWSVLTIFLIW